MSLSTSNEKIRERKAELRSRMRRARRGMSFQEREAASSAICTRASTLDLGGGPIAVYLATQFEPSLDPFINDLIGRQIIVAAPREVGFALLDRDPRELLVQGGSGPRFREPQGEEVKIEEIRTFFIPGLGFDENFNRLGQGGGWYDRILEHRSETSTVIGVCFASELLKEVPHETHDRRVDAVLTPEIYFR